MDLIGNIVDSNERILIGQTIAVTVLTLWVVQESFAPPTQVQNGSGFIVGNTFEPTLPNLNIP
jgi:hypothetical protein